MGSLPHRADEHSRSSPACKSHTGTPVPLKSGPAKDSVPLTRTVSSIQLRAASASGLRCHIAPRRLRESGKDSVPLTRLDPLPDPLWGEGQLAKADAGSLEDGVGNGGSDAVGGDFPHSFGAKGSIGIRLLHQVNFDGGNFLDGGDAVVAEAGIEDLALFISERTPSRLRERMGSPPHRADEHSRSSPACKSHTGTPVPLKSGPAKDSVPLTRTDPIPRLWPTPRWW